MLRHYRRIRSRLQTLVPSLDLNHGAYRWWALGAVMVGTFMAVLDATIVNVSLAKIMAAFGVDVSEIEWVMTGYLLAFGVLLPTSGWLCTRFGCKRVYVASLLIFTVGSGLCGLAWNEKILIAFRILQGVGAGCLQPTAMTIVSLAFPPERRGMALGIWTIAGGASATLGPTIGGWLVENVGWRSIFYINLPIGVLGLILVAFVLHETERQPEARFDALGFFAMATFLSTLLLALAEGNREGWDSAYIRTCEIIAAVSLVIFLVQELTIRQPVINLHLFKHSAFSLANSLTFIFGVSLFGSIFLVPLFVQNLLNYTALQAGILMLPGGIAMAITSPIAGRLSDRIQPRWLIASGLLILAWSMGLNAEYMQMPTDYWALWAAVCLRGVGMGLLFTPLMTAALVHLTPRDMGVASGLLNVIRQIGGSFGVAMFSTLLERRTLFHQAVLAESLPVTAQALYSNGMEGGSAVAQLLPRLRGVLIQRGIPPAMAGMAAGQVLAMVIGRGATIIAFEDCFRVAMWLSLGALIFAFLLPRRRAAPSRPEPKPAPVAE